MVLIRLDDVLKHRKVTMSDISEVSISRDTSTVGNKNDMEERYKCAKKNDAGYI